MPPSSPRLFLAFPANRLQRQLEHLQDRLSLPGRRIPAHQFHLTLRFLGPLTPEQQQQLEQRVDQLPLESFTLELDRLGCFARARVVWIGPTQIPEPLITLAGQAELAVQELGLAAPRSQFHPHISLFRHARGRTRPVIPPIDYRPERLVLYASSQSEAGPVYHSLRSWPLTTG